MFGVVFSRFLAIIFAASVLSSPALAQNEPPPLDAYGELPGIEGIALSPSGKRIAMLLTLDGVRMLLVVDENFEAKTTFRVDDVKVRRFDFVNDDLILLQRSSTEDLGVGFIQDKFEFYQAVILQVSDGSVELVFDGRRNLLNAVFGYYGMRLVEGRPHAFFGAIELEKSTSGRTVFVFKHGRPALYSVDLLKNNARRASASAPEGEDRDWLVGADGQVAARLDRSESSGGWEIRGSRGVVASGSNPAGGVYLVALGKDGTTVIYGARSEETQAIGWFEVPLDGSDAPREVFAHEDIERIFTERLSGHLIGYLRGNEALEPVFFDEGRTQKVQKVRKAFAQFNNRMVDWTDDFDQVIVRTRGNGDSGSYFTVNIAELRAQAVAWERPLIGPDQVGPISTVAYTAADGLEMDGILTLPPDREAVNLPVIMLPHGGPHSHDIESFYWWAQAFASRGYAVFQPNFRGSTNRDLNFVQAGYGEWGSKMQTDISDGLAMLAEKGIVDPARACIIGASYGGYAALAGVTLQQGLYRCAVSVNGVSDVSLMSKIERRESGYSKVTTRSLARQLGPRSRYREISPRHHAANADAPILLIHGRDDTVVAYDQSRKMADALKDEGKPYEFVELAGEDHWLSLSSTRKAMLEATMEFVQRHNPAD